VPANKGLRRPGYSVGRGRMQSTQFKKGQKPRHAKARMPAGTFDDPLGDAYKLARAAIDAASGKP